MVREVESCVVDTAAWVLPVGTLLVYHAELLLYESRAPIFYKRKLLESCAGK